MTDAFIYDAVRSPRGKGRPDGSLHELTSVALSAKVLNAVKERDTEQHFANGLVCEAGRRHLVDASSPMAPVTGPDPAPPAAD